MAISDHMTYSMPFIRPRLVLYIESNTAYISFLYYIIQHFSSYIKEDDQTKNTLI